MPSPLPCRTGVLGLSFSLSCTCSWAREAQAGWSAAPGQRTAIESPGLLGLAGISQHLRATLLPSRLPRVCSDVVEEASLGHPVPAPRPGWAGRGSPGSPQPLSSVLVLEEEEVLAAGTGPRPGAALRCCNFWEKGEENINPRAGVGGASGSEGPWPGAGDGFTAEGGNPRPSSLCRAGFWGLPEGACLPPFLPLPFPRPCTPPPPLLLSSLLLSGCIAQRAGPDVLLCWEGS